MGMFATSKKWWTHIRGMDDGLLEWGGENIEISLRTWLCGGEVVVARDSYIDHAWSNKIHYTRSGEIYTRNKMRVAEAWMDPASLATFYKVTGIHRDRFDIGDLSRIRELQRELQCKPFTYYLDKFLNVAPAAMPDAQKK